MSVLIHGDCLEVLQTLETHSVDFILTDPPYGTTACKWDTVIPFEPMWEQIWRVLKPNGACALFGSEPFSSHLRMSQIKYFKYDWIWEKERGTGIGNAKKMPMKKHELVSVFYRRLPFYDSVGEKLKKPYKHLLPISDSETGSITGSIKKAKKTGEKRKTALYTHATKNSVIKFQRVQKAVGYEKHPTQKPVPLLEYLIKTYTLEGETVLDFTMGSGSTGVAAKNLNRNFIGIEKDEKYFQIAKERIDAIQTSL